MTKPWTYNVLFLCTGNSARSIIAEALLRAEAGERFRCYSAGSRPTGRINPLALELLERNHLPTASLRSKSWDEFAAPGAPQLDFIFTVCDNAAGEVCPIWPGHPVTAHWGLPDPAAVTESPAEQAAAFRETFRVLETRIRFFLTFQFKQWGPAKLRRMAAEAGKLQSEPAS